MRRRITTAGRAAVAVGSALLATSCSTAIPGQAVTSVCAREGIARCTDYVPVEPVGGGRLMDVWLDDSQRAGNMMCTALSEQQLERFMGGPYYRYLKGARSHSCTIVSDQKAVTGDNGMLRQPQRFVVATALYPQPMQGYEIVRGNERTTVAGHPAWINKTGGAPGETTYGYTISTGTSPTSGGVLFVEVSVLRGEGDHTDRPLDLSPLRQREEIAAAYVNALLE